MYIYIYSIAILLYQYIIYTMMKNPRYLQAILDETLRVKPPSGGGFRLAEEELQIGAAARCQGRVGPGGSFKERVMV